MKEKNIFWAVPEVPEAPGTRWVLGHSPNGGKGQCRLNLRQGYLIKL